MATALESRRQPDIDEVEDLVLRNEALPDRENVRVIVRTRQAS
jgi:hypothetical protein